MPRIDRADVQWRRVRRGRVQHAVQAAGDSGFRAVCGETGWLPPRFWFAEPTAPECRTCAKRVTPA